MDAYSTDDQQYVGLEELLPDDEDVSPIEYTNQVLLEAELDKVFSTLSEREAGVIRLRYGLVDGEPRTLDEIGMIYGLTRERIRQIESKVMGKLRHPSRSEPLRDFLDVESTQSSHYWSAETVRAQRDSARLLGQHILKTTVYLTPESRASSEEDAEPEAREAYEVVEAIFTDLLLNANAYNFQQSFARSVDSLYPKGLIDTIEETCGRDLTVEHIEQFWNTHLELLIERIEQAIGDDVSFDRIGQLFSALLAERITDEDHITLNIPPNADGKLGFVGAWIQNGRLAINGNVGNHVGYRSRGLSEITVLGDAGDYAAMQATGYAHVIITGSTGDMLGFRAGEESAIAVRGNAGDFAAACLWGQANVTIEGNAGDYCACEINNPYVDIKVDGNVGAFLADKAVVGLISVAGSAESYSPQANFKGQLYIDGKKVRL